MKWFALNVPLPWPKGLKTRPEVEQGAGGRARTDFSRDRDELIRTIDRFCGPDPALGSHPHPIFGLMSTRSGCGGRICTRIITCANSGYRRGPVATIRSCRRCSRRSSEQPDALERTLNNELPGIEELRRRLEKHRPRLIVLAARGTSDNAATFGRYLLEITTGIPVSLAAPSIFTLYDAHIDYKDALVVAISSPANRPTRMLFLERAREQGVVTVGITNEAGERLARMAEHVFLVRAGKEKSVAATKTYTGQLMAFYLLAYALGAPIDLRRLRAPSVDRRERAFAGTANRHIVGTLHFMDHAVVVARGLNYSNAFEFALKLMETCYVVAERFSSADLLHGPIAMVEHRFRRLSSRLREWLGRD